MADSSVKTEQPTPKKLKEGAKQGQVPRSADIAAWTGLLALSFLLPFFIGYVSDDLQELLKTIPEIAREPSLTRLASIVMPALLSISIIMIPLLLAILLVTQVSGWVQGGARPHLARVQPKTSKISPQQNGKRIFGTRGLWELAKQILKVSVIGLVLWVVITRTVEIVFESGLLSLSTLTEIAASEGTRLVQVVIAAGLAIAVADYFVSQRRVRRELMMSKREVKEELKQSEGDPLLRAALRQRALDASRNRLVALPPTRPRGPIWRRQRRPPPPVQPSASAGCLCSRAPRLRWRGTRSSQLGTRLTDGHAIIRSPTDRRPGRRMVQRLPEGRPLRTWDGACSANTPV